VSGLPPGTVRRVFAAGGSNLIARAGRAIGAALQPADNGRFLNHEGAAPPW
jgi:hypothetical protein